MNTRKNRCENCITPASWKVKLSTAALVDKARVQFKPNGTCDEMRMILFDGRERIGVELEVTTGLASVVPDPLREWTRR